jgi:hypothetical protein
MGLKKKLRIRSSESIEVSHRSFYREYVYRKALSATPDAEICA